MRRKFSWRFKWDSFSSLSILPPLSFYAQQINFLLFFLSFHFHLNFNPSFLKSFLPFYIFNSPTRNVHPTNGPSANNNLSFTPILGVRNSFWKGNTSMVSITPFCTTTFCISSLWTVYMFGFDTSSDEVHLSLIFWFTRCPSSACLWVLKWHLPFIIGCHIHC